MIVFFFGLVLFWVHMILGFRSFLGKKGGMMALHLHGFGLD